MFKPNKPEPRLTAYQPNILVRAGLLQTARQEKWSVWMEQQTGNALVLALAHANLRLAAKLSRLHDNGIRFYPAEDPRRSQALAPLLRLVAEAADLSDFAKREDVIGPIPQQMYSPLTMSLANIKEKWSILIEHLQKPEYPYLSARQAFFEVAWYMANLLLMEFVQRARLDITEIGDTQQARIDAEGIFTNWKLSAIILPEDHKFCDLFAPETNCNLRFFRPKTAPTIINFPVTNLG